MKTFTAKIISLNTPKTAGVSISIHKKDKIYKKITYGIRRLQVHYENLDLKIGNTVLIGEIRPKSKTKHFQVIKTLN